MGNDVTLVPLESDGSVLQPSAIYSPDSYIQTVELDESEVQRRFFEFKREQSKRLKENSLIRELSDGEIQKVVRRVLTREAIQKEKSAPQSQSLTKRMSKSEERIFGKSAIEHNVYFPTNGSFIKSPKVFLGSELSEEYLRLFESVVAQMLGNMIEKTSALHGKSITQAVIGRPIQYHGNRGEAGNEQAIEIMQKAASRAGLKDVVFMYEPLAAALDYEKNLCSDQTILVVDVGGGTTDCSVVKVGPSRRDKIRRERDLLGFAGDRIGGIDMDISLGWSEMMPYLGKDTRRYHLKALDAISVNNIPRQNSFYSNFDRYYHDDGTELVAQRLYKVFKEHLTERLAHSAELAKIALSDKQSITLPLKYIEPGLQIMISRQSLREAIDRDLSKISNVIREAIKLGSSKLDAIYITGGAALSPVVLNSIKAVVNNKIPIITGNMYESVTIGLTNFASVYFGPER